MEAGGPQVGEVTHLLIWARLNDRWGGAATSMKRGP